MENKQLKSKGEVDYDYKQDILFFKTSERDYAKSIELENLVLDVDKEGFIVGIQIFEASKFLNISRNMLLKIPTWQFEANVRDGRIEFRLMFQIVVRNKIIEKNPIIMQPISEPLPNSNLICEA
ncbi:MAG: DUF2283 domain-containing protein [Nanoarchaeota archaeon]|nr:DUF2283 domain-containing protein [Nanoarchaeota archaeon]